MPETINGVTHPVNGDFVNFTGSGAGTGDLGVLAATAGANVAVAAGAAGAAALAAANAYTDQALSQSGTSGSLTPVTTNTTIPVGTDTGELAGYINVSASPIVVSGTTLPAGAWAVWTWVGGSWLLLNTSGSGEPDTEPPTAPTNLVATPGYNSATLTWTPATDDTGVAGYEARTQKTGDAWSSWAAATSGGSVTGLAPASGYTVEVRARDFAGNRGPAASTTVTTTAIPPGTVIASDTFSRADSATSMGVTEVGGLTWTPAMPAGVQFGIASGSAYCSTPELINGTTVIETGVADVALTVDLTTTAYAGVILRYVDPTNYVFARYNAAQLGLYSATEGSSLVTIGTYAATKAVGTPFTLKVIADGPDLAVYMDGALVISGTSTAHQAATKHGLQLRTGSTPGLADNFAIEAA